MSLTRWLDEARRIMTRNGGVAGSGGRDGASAGATGKQRHSAREYVRDLVYGGLDGIVTTFAVVSAVVGSNLGAEVVLVLGAANLVADGFSMGAGAYLSAKSEHEYYEQQRNAEAEQIDGDPEQGRNELYDIYRNHGYDDHESDALTSIQTRRKERWVDAMLVYGANLLRGNRKPLYEGLVTFVAFCLAGLVPLLAYLIGMFRPVNGRNMFVISIGLSALALFGLGSAKTLVTKQGWLRSGIEMLLIGGLAALVAYGIGAWLGGLGG